MKFIPSLLAIFVVFCFLSLVGAQEKSSRGTKEFPYVEIVDCMNCNDLVISLPIPDLQRPLDVIPYKNRGAVSVQIFVDKEGNVEKAQAIEGHPFFRPILE